MRRQRLDAKEIEKRTKQALAAFTEEWAVVVIDRHGERKYLAPGFTFSPFRGNSARFDCEATALEQAREVRTFTWASGHRRFPWIADTEVERIK